MPIISHCGVMALCKYLKKIDAKVVLDFMPPHTLKSWRGILLLTCLSVRPHNFSYGYCNFSTVAARLLEFDIWIPHKKIANPYFSYYSYLPLWSYGPLNFFEKILHNHNLEQLSEAAFMTQVSAACSITLLTHVEYYLPRVTRGKLRFVRKGSSWQNLSQAHLQLVTGR